MPNWVSNSISINGSAEEIKNFKERASQPYKTYWENESDQRQQELSFMNFISPPQEAIASGEYWGTHGFVKGEQVGHTPNNWYEFNTREWGVKWDASDVDITEEGETYLTYYFQTPWGIPEPVFRVMVAEHPNLEFKMNCVEEQGWGAEYEGVDGELTLTDEWDIPQTHEEMMKRQGYCDCEHYDASDPEEREYLYDDCPSMNLDTEDAVRILEEVNPKF